MTHLNEKYERLFVTYAPSYWLYGSGDDQPPPPPVPPLL
jgi:hypothetical protein